MGKGARGIAIGALSLIYASPVFAQAVPQEPTGIYIRRQAGLPAESANGQIEIVDVGHHPLDTMLSIVAHRTDKGWSVSYACADSPQCAPNDDHKALSYALSGPDSAEVDGILKTLKGGKEPDGQLPSPTFIGGNLLVSIDDDHFKRQYRRSGFWGKTLGRLETLLSPPAG